MTGGTDPSDDLTLAAGPLTLHDRGSVREAVVERGMAVGRYTVLGRLGAGGMGVVYAAWDTELDRKVALKLLHPSGYGSTVGSDGQRRLLREAQAMARLSHPNAVTVHDVGTFGDRVFVAMEFVDGWTVTRWLAEQPRRWPEAIDLYRQAALGLAAAHAAGLVHRDFKPDNVMIGRDGRVRVMDFGLARASGDLADVGPAIVASGVTTSGSGRVSERMTRTGALVGTPAYMAPEQHVHRRADPLSDQFSFCVALHEALYGRRPFDGDNVHALAFNVTTGRIAREPAAADVPAWLRAVVVRGLSVEPADRWPSMDALAEALADRRRRPGARLAIGVGVLSIAAATAAVLVERRAERPCRDADQALAGAWDPARRDVVADAFAATGLPFADASLAPTLALLDEYAAAWVAARTDACEDTRVRGEMSDALLDRRIACLDQRRRALDAAAELLERPDAQVVENAVGLAAALPSVTPCEDVTALLAGVPAPAEAIAERVDAVRGDLARVDAGLVAGHYDAGRVLATAALEAAAELDYAPLQAEAWLRRAWMEEATGDAAAAEVSALEAWWLARAAGHERAAIEAGSFLAFVVGHRLDRHAEGMVWSKTALAELAHHGVDPELRAQVLTNQGSVLESAGDYVAGAERHRQAIELLEGALGPEHHRVARARHGLAIALLETGEASAAIAEERRAIAIREATLGADHPLLGRSRLTLGNGLRQLGDYDGALAEYREGLRILEAALGRHHPDVAQALGSVAIGRAMLGDHAGAVATFRDACARSRAVHGEDGVEHAGCLSNLGNALMLAGDADEALAVYREALRIREVRLGADHPETGTSHGQVGDLLTRAGDLTPATAHLRRSVEIRRASLGPDHPRLAFPRLMLGEALLLAGDPDGALAEFEEALRIRVGGEVAPMDVGETEFAVARALHRLGRDEGRVAALVASARARFEAVGEPAAQHLRDLEDWERSAG